MFAELRGKEPGYCRGKGGSMHIADPETGNLGANAIVGGSAGIATGAALSAKMRGSGQVAVCFFGDGALGQGLLYETMNMASLWKLPVIYVGENNLWRVHAGQLGGRWDLARARAFCVTPKASAPSRGQISRTMRRLVERARGEGRRSWVGLPLHGHHVGDVNRKFRCATKGLDDAPRPAQTLSTGSSIRVFPSRRCSAHPHRVQTGVIFRRPVWIKPPSPAR
jgi:pyruvate dehydrogenase E1 component alpha subunit